jgi:chromate transporter
MSELDRPLKLTHLALFSGFFQAGIIGFGGVLPIARRMIVEEWRWMSQAAFNDLFSLCQFMPGANIVNFSLAFGARQRGITGALAAVAGLLAAPVLIVLACGTAYARYGNLPPARHALAGLAAAAAGLVLATALKIATPTFRGAPQIAVTVLVVALVLLAHLSLPLTMVITLPLSLLLAWRA